ncbi:MAG TPA: Ig-like domain repeat protein [Vicinamibacterales bacterium]|nr:Ig-like domain repeat protein [Vicinamibacterales bacterium]
MHFRKRRLTIVLLFVLAALWVEERPFAQGDPAGTERHESTDRHEGARRPAGEEPGDDRRISGMGHVARLAATGRLRNAIERARAAKLGVSANDDDGAGFPGGQAETSIAVDSTGQHIVVGNNDTRGFNSNPISVSGFAYSDDGGATFVDGGQLPVTTGTSTLNGTTYPQVFGDPEVKYLGGSTFLYFSIMVKKFSSTGTAQTMGVHRSTDNGHTWQGPYEIGPATNPNGLKSGDNAFDAADKEFADVDPDTGRVMTTWSNFTSTGIAPGGVEISSTYSDNAATATPPTWSTRVIIANTALDGQASIPRFAGHGSNNVYVAWRQFPPAFGSQNVGFARSTNNGVSFSGPISLAPADFLTMDYVLGNDRSNTSPALAVDNSSSPYSGDIYLVYSNNDNNDGADIVFQKSTDQGLIFSAPVKINSRPGTDRAQWFPWVTVDSSSGRVYVFYYDEGIAADGDLTETTYQHSDDGGTTWSKPMPLTDRPFHAGYGNDTGQPNIGDYNQATAQGGDLLAVWAGTPEFVGFADGEPASLSMTEPSVFFKRVHATGGDRLAVSLGTISFTDSGPTVLGGNGFIDAGEQVAFTIPLTNDVTNSLNAGAVSGITAALSTTTPGVTVLHGGSTYPNLAAGATGANNSSFVISVAPSFPASTHIELSLAVTSAQGSTTLLFSEPTGTPAGAPLTTTLLSENFDEVAAGSLPAGWMTAHGGGGNVVPWTTSNQSLGASPTPISNAAFHENADDGTGGDNTRWERLFSPIFVVPSTSEYVTADFDVAYDTEDEPLLKIQAYDGALLRVFDQTSGRMQRSVAVEAFAEQFTTGAENFYPKHLMRSSNGNYFQDLSAWAGDSSGYKHVHLKLPGMAGSTVQLRFEFTQDNGRTCADVRPGHRCGVLIDNIVVKSVQSVTPAQLSLAPSVNPATVGQAVTFTATVTTAAGTFPSDGSVTFSEGSSTLAGPTALASGKASFTTSTLAAGPHTITATYSSSSGTFSSAAGSVSEVLGSATTASISTNNLTFGKQLVGTSSVASQAVHFTNTGANALIFSTFNGAAPTATFSVGGGDFQGRTNCPLTPAGLSPGLSCDFSFSSSPTAVGLRSAGFAIADNTLSFPQNIALSGTGFVVDAPTVVQTLTTGGSRLRSLQNPDGGWFFEAGLTSCVAGSTPNVSCVNITGVTALGMLGAYTETRDPAVLAALTAAGNAIVKRYNSSLPSPPIPYNQDIEFLAWLSQLTSTPSYLTTATAWFQVGVTQYPIAENRVAAIMTARNNQGLRSLVAWDAASLIRAAKAVGNTLYASGIATSVLNHEADWKDENPASPLPGNIYSYYLTILGEGSLLWAEHDLPGFSAPISEYTNFLLGSQDAVGSWDGDMQVSAYVTVGLAAVGGAKTNSALQSVAAFFIENQLPDGGWVAYADGSGNPVENVEINGEVARAMATFFNTTAGSSVSVAPAQLSRLTFNSVTIPGRTLVVANPLPTGTRVPGGYTILDSLTYEVATSASFSGSTSVCFSVPWVTDPVQFSMVRVLHDERGVLVDRTIRVGPLAPNFAARTVCAAVSSLDAFAIATKTMGSKDHSGEDRGGDGEDRDGQEDRDRGDKKDRKENKSDKND